MRNINIDQVWDPITRTWVYDAYSLYKMILADDGREDASAYYEACVEMMDDDLREELHDRLAPCSEAKFLKTYCKEHIRRFGSPFIVN